MAAKNQHTEVPGGGHKFPPLQTETYASQLLWLALTFVGLYLLMSRIALPRIGSIIADRRQRIEGDFAEAERLKRESDAALAGYEKSLADARGRAQPRPVNGRPKPPRAPAKRSMPSSIPRSPTPKRRSRRAGRLPWPTSRASRSTPPGRSSSG